MVFHVEWADGAASVAIGVLLVGIAGVLANETRSLITGEAVAPPVLEEIRRLLDADDRVVDVHDVATLHLGPHSILVALTITFNSDLHLEAPARRDPRADGGDAKGRRADRLRLRPPGRRVTRHFRRASSGSRSGSLPARANATAATSAVAVARTSC